MISFWGAGSVELSLTSADTARLLAKLTESGIFLYETRVKDDLTIFLRIRRTDLNDVRKWADKYGAELSVTSRKGIYWKIRSFMRRPLLTGGLLLLLLMGIWMPERIFFVEVEGNNTVPTRLILEAAEGSGVGFGADRREMRSEKVKNALLSRIPELRWAGVNTYGSRAVITVREREPAQEHEQQHGVSSIVADRDGLILTCTTENGTALVRPGQAVKTGQLLISGYTDCGISIRAGRAQGEVFAQTGRELTVLTPLNRTGRGQELEMDVKFSLLIGKKRINFYKGSGISDAGCVKMYWKYILTLPGGFELPFALIKETVSFYETEEAVRDPDSAASELSEFAQRYLLSQMIGGSIISCTEQLEAGDVLRLTGQYACQEMIGREKAEQIGVYDGKTD